MPKQTATLISGLIAAAAVPQDGARGAWMKIIPAGTFTLRDGRGPFVAGDRASMQGIVDRTLTIAGQTELMVDYDHQAHFSAVPGVGGTAKAAGWAKQIEARDDGIYALVEWTETAAAAIRAQEYRYLSPLFGSDKKSGRVTHIANVGLVNMPAMDLVAVAARAETTEQDHNMKAIAKMLGLAEDASEEQILAALKSHMDAKGKAMTAAGLKPDATPEALIETIAAMVADRGKIAAAVGLSPDAKADAILVAARAGGSVDPSKFVPIEDLVALRDDFASLKERVDGEDATRAVDAAIKAGRLIPAQRDWGLQLFAANRKSFDDYVGSAPVLTAAQRGDGRKVTADVQLDDADLVVARQMGLTTEQMIAAKKGDA